jgi:membrane associated rhomboid family serine protease
MAILLIFTTNAIKNLLGEELPKKLFAVGILMGGIFFLFFNGSNGSLIGASAGISSLLLFLLLMSPDLSVKLFRFSIKFKYLMGLIFFMDFLKLISPGEYGVYSHIGGYLAGMFYYFSLYGFPRLKTKSTTRKRYKHTYSKQSKVDKILDKISKSGYDSLNSEEKEFLFKQGGKK